MGGIIFSVSMIVMILVAMGIFKFIFPKIGLKNNMFGQSILCLFVIVGAMIMGECIQRLFI